MATKSFSSLAERAKQSWSTEAKTVYEAATASYTAEVETRTDLGRMLAQARRKRRLSQSELSRASGIQQAEISKIEHGRGNPTLATLERLTQPLGLRLALTSGAASASPGKQPV